MSPPSPPSPPSPRWLSAVGDDCTTEIKAERVRERSEGLMRARRAERPPPASARSRCCGYATRHSTTTISLRLPSLTIRHTGAKGKRCHHLYEQNVVSPLTYPTCTNDVDEKNAYPAPARSMYAEHRGRIDRWEIEGR